MNRAPLCRMLSLLAMMVVLAGCRRDAGELVQGYVEGEYVHVASPFAGELEKLSIQRGTQVAAGTPLFALESKAETALRDEAARRIEEAESRLEDAKKGLRPSEIESLDAQLNQARAALVLARIEVTRLTELVATKTVPLRELDQARTTLDQDQDKVVQLEADLKTARLGARSDQVAAAESNVKALRAALAKAEWDLGQKQQQAPVAAMVFDTLYQEGEWVPASRPVVSLLPPANIKVRAFVPEPRIANIHTGDAVKVLVDGVGEVTGKVSFISPRAEFTPPVIYSQENRGKFVFMIEIAFAPDVAARLHPGQPVDVRF